ncbi:MULTISPECIES: hypothetical protein [Myroides]|uniref:Lipoprotein n=1 Tax=Myroides albus TaxID=2562892 RepID=A0A6I3LI78_9FLAO|nr:MULTISPECIES: hypothetical protein [Myroides]MTG99299.1 hypothetical protein [Myroides albus]MVX37290.1 hypothetical protein [Myroides sp. LoEW2-1]
MKKLIFMASCLCLGSMTTSCSSDDSSPQVPTEEDKSLNLTIENSKGTYLKTDKEAGVFNIVLDAKDTSVNLNLISNKVEEKDLLDARLTSQKYLVSDSQSLYSLTQESSITHKNEKLTILSGELDIKNNDQSYSIEGYLVDNNKQTYTIKYNSDIDIEPVYQVNYDFQNGWYWGDNPFDNPGIGEYLSFFSFGEKDKYGDLEGDGHAITITFFDEMASKAWEAKIPNKTFKSSSEFEKGTFKVISKKELEELKEGEQIYNVATLQVNNKAENIKAELYIIDGSIKVLDKNGKQEVRFNVELEDGTRHIGKYSGNVRQGDEFTVTTLKSDKQVEQLDFGYLEYKGKSPITGKELNRWNIFLFNNKLKTYPENYWQIEGSGDYLRLTMYTDVSMTTDIPTGEFTIGEEEVGFIGKGGGSEPGLDWGTWYYNVLNGDMNQYAPLKTGKVKVSKNNDTYTITIDAIDDRENKITASYSSKLQFVDHDINKNRSLGLSNKAMNDKAKNKFEKTKQLRTKQLMNQYFGK